jgi:hypothetical protein
MVALGLRHMGLNWFNLRHQHAGIDVWFWRMAPLPVWERIRRRRRNTTR